MIQIRVTDPSTGQVVTLTVPESFRNLPRDRQAGLVRQAIARQRAATPESTDQPEPAVRAEDLAAEQTAHAAMVPEGAAIHQADGTTVYPGTGVRYTRDPDATFDEQMIAGRAGAIRDSSARNFIDRNNPFIASAVMGGTYALADEAAGLVDPVVSETMRQAYEQGQEDHPILSLTGEIAGGVGSGLGVYGIAARNFPRVLSFADRLFRGGGRVRNAAAGTAAGIGQTAAYEYNAARPGDRFERATDPLTLALGGAIGGGVGAVLSRAAPYQPEQLALPAPALALPGPDGPYGTPSTPSAAPTAARGPDLAAPLEAPAQARGSNARSPEEELREYLDRVAPQATGDAAVDNTAAALRQGVDLPIGALNPGVEGRARAASRSLGWGRGFRNAMERGRNALAERAQGVIGEVGDPMPGGSAPDLVSSIRDNLGTRRQGLEARYNEMFDSDAIPRIDVTPSDNARQRVEDILQSRIDSGSPMNRAGTDTTDHRYIRDAVRLLRGDSVSIDGLRRARSELNSAIQSAERMAIPTPRVRDMETMRDILTDEIYGYIHRAVPDEDQAARLVDELAQVDQGYRVLNDTERDYEGMLEGLNSSALRTVQNAFSSGGENALTELRRLRENSPDQWSNVMAMTLDRAGRSSDGDFDPATFARNWGRLSMDARREMFSESHMSDLDDIARLAGRMSEMSTNPPVGRGQQLRDDAGALIGGVGLLLPGSGMEIMGFGIEAVRALRSRSLSRPADARHLRTFLDNMDRASSQEGAARRVALQRGLRALRRIGGGAAAGGATGGSLGSVIDGIEQMLQSDDNGQQSAD